MSFRNFASTLREQAAVKAKEAAQRLQTMDLPTGLPTFDDMAAKDEYIHSDEFNVRGQPKQWKKSPPGEMDLPASSSPSSSPSSSLANNHVPDTVNMMQGDEASACTTESSWSLLDRPRMMQHSGGSVMDGKDEELGFGCSNHERSEGRQVHESPSIPHEDYGNSSRPKNDPSSAPLLSVVANALEDTPKVSKTMHPAALGGVSFHAILPNIPQHHDDRLSSHNVDDSDVDDSDDEDPILLAIRNDAPSSERGGKRIRDVGVKSSNRFMDDLEKRLNAPQADASLVMVEAGISPAAETDASVPQVPEPSRSPLLFTRGPFNGYFMNMAASSATRFWKKAQNDSAGSSSTLTSRKGEKNAPPLARERATKKATTSSTDLLTADVNFQVTTSTSVLADEDMARLHQFKMQPSTGLSAAMLFDQLYENRQFVFIFFTLVLALIVYWYTSHIVEDDVT